MIITHRDIMRHILYLYEYDDMFKGANSYQIHMYVTDIESDKVTLTIALSRPGSLIGVKGVIIEHLAAELTKFCKVPVEIAIVEFDPLYNDNIKIWNLQILEKVSPAIPNSNVDISRVL